MEEKNWCELDNEGFKLRVKLYSKRMERMLKKGVEEKIFDSLMDWCCVAVDDVLKERFLDMFGAKVVQYNRKRTGEGLQYQRQDTGRSNKQHSMKYYTAKAFVKTIYSWYLKERPVLRRMRPQSEVNGQRYGLILYTVARDYCDLARESTEFQGKAAEWLRTFWELLPVVRKSGNVPLTETGTSLEHIQHCLEEVAKDILTVKQQRNDEKHAQMSEFYQKQLEFLANSMNSEEKTDEKHSEFIQNLFQKKLVNNIKKGKMNRVRKCREALMKLYAKATGHSPVDTGTLEEDELFLLKQLNRKRKTAGKHNECRVKLMDYWHSLASSMKRFESLKDSAGEFLVPSLHFEEIASFAIERMGSSFTVQDHAQKQDLVRKYTAFKEKSVFLLRNPSLVKDFAEHLLKNIVSDYQRLENTSHLVPRYSLLLDIVKQNSVVLLNVDPYFSTALAAALLTHLNSPREDLTPLKHIRNAHELTHDKETQYLTRLIMKFLTLSTPTESLLDTLNYLISSDLANTQFYSVLYATHSSMTQDLVALHNSLGTASKAFAGQLLTATSTVNSCIVCISKIHSPTVPELKLNLQEALRVSTEILDSLTASRAPTDCSSSDSSQDCSAETVSSLNSLHSLYSAGSAILSFSQFECFCRDFGVSLAPPTVKALFLSQSPLTQAQFISALTPLSALHFSQDTNSPQEKTRLFIEKLTKN